MSITIHFKSDYKNMLPYPYHIDEEGKIERQDFWKGSPSQIIGFTDDVDVFEIKLLLPEFLINPKSCIGKYPIFKHSTGELFTYALPVASISINK